MAKFRVFGSFTAGVDIIVEADSLENAIDVADRVVDIYDYDNGFVRVESNDDSVEVESVSGECSYIEWETRFSKEVVE